MQKGLTHEFTKYRHLVVVIQRHLCNTSIQICYNLFIYLFIYFFECAHMDAEHEHVGLRLSSICAWDTECVSSLSHILSFSLFISVLLTQNFNLTVKLLLFLFLLLLHFRRREKLRHDLEGNERQHQLHLMFCATQIKLRTNEKETNKKQQQCKQIEIEKYWFIILIVVLPFGIHIKRVQVKMVWKKKFMMPLEWNWSVRYECERERVHGPMQY